MLVCATLSDKEIITYLGEKLSNSPNWFVCAMAFGHDALVLWAESFDIAHVDVENLLRAIPLGSVTQYLPQFIYQAQHQKNIIQRIGGSTVDANIAWVIEHNDLARCMGAPSNKQIFSHLVQGVLHYFKDKQLGREIVLNYHKLAKEHGYTIGICTDDVLLFGDLQLLKYYVTRGFFSNCKMWDHRFKNCTVEMLQFLKDNGVTWMFDSFERLVVHPDVPIDVFIWCMRNGCSRPKNALGLLLEQPNKKRIDWWMKEYPEATVSANILAPSMDVKTITWIIAAFPAKRWEFVKHLVQTNNFSMLKYFEAMNVDGSVEDLIKVFPKSYSTDSMITMLHSIAELLNLPYVPSKYALEGMVRGAKKLKTSQ
jgi:hypothetical protein